MYIDYRPQDEITEIEIAESGYQNRWQYTPFQAHGESAYLQIHTLHIVQV